MNEDQTSATEMKIQREAQAWVVRLESGAVTEEDARAFKSWCAQSRDHARCFAQARQVWSSMGQALRHGQNQGQCQEAAHGVVRGDNGSAAGFGRRAFLGGALAASVGYLAVRPPLGLWPSIGDLAADVAADYQTGTGEQRSVAIAGGLHVQMNTQTRLNVDDGDAGIAGVRLLNGEAEFDVERLSVEKVAVKASTGIVYARHARFQVRYTDSDVCVTCTRGSVEIRLAQQNMALHAGQQLTFSARALGTPVSADTTAVTAWKRRMLVFSQATLAQVVDEVNRYRSGKLILRGERLAQQKVQASFSLDRLEDVVALIRDVYGARTTSLPGGIVIFQQA